MKRTWADMGHSAGMRADIATSIGMNLAIRVKAVDTTRYVFDCFAQLYPAGKTDRAPKVSEVKYQVQYNWGTSTWTDWTPERNAFSADNGHGQIIVMRSGMDAAKLAAGTLQLRFLATHVESTAQTSKTIMLNAYGGISEVGTQQTNVGNEMPSTWSQNHIGGGHLGVMGRGGIQRTRRIGT